MMRATWHGVTIAESERTIRVEGNHYFPAEDVRREFLRPSTTHTRCPWKGTASYYSVAVNGQSLSDAAWYYPDPSPAAASIAGHIAFWRGVKVERVREPGDRAERTLLPRLFGHRITNTDRV